MPARLRALVVDDNRLAREVLERRVESLGWSVDLAESGAQALARLQSGPAAYDAVFVDWQMPGLDGWQTCEQIRALSSGGGAPLMVMVTAHGREMLAQRAAAEQALIDGFLVKPVTASMLYDAVVDARAARGDTPKPRRSAAAPARRLDGLHLLLVEDNANNQQVARELLEDEGAEVQIACNGLQAVEAVAAADPPFDAVLMDLQMPVMDGYTATGRIRQDLGRIELPIVAMTANAMASDREACLAAGMDDHVGKPFDLDHLVMVLRRLCGRTGPAPSAPSARELHTLKGVAATLGVTRLASAAADGERQLNGGPTTTQAAAAPSSLESMLADSDMPGARHGLMSPGRRSGPEARCACQTNFRPRSAGSRRSGLRCRPSRTDARRHGSA
ncbi:MAG: response regulator [Burkholderiales bacterium]|nr:response regulator [Burkholderiales bacterium]